MDILGVTDYVRLGGDGRFRDSGMAYDDKGHATARDVLRDGIFWTTDLLEAANELVPLIRSRRPQVLVHLQPVRRLRAPGPHPGPPGGDVRHPAGRRARVPARPGRGVDGVPGAVEHDEQAADDRRDQGAARGRRLRDLQGVRSRGWPDPDDRRRRPDRRRDRRYAVGPAEAGRDARPRHPDHRGRAVLRRGQGARRRPVVPGVLPARRRRSLTRTRDGWADDLFAGLD